MKIAIIGDPHGVTIPKNKIPKDVEAIIIPGDLGNADIYRNIYFNNLERKNKGLEEKEPSKTLLYKAYMETHKTAVKVIKYYSKIAPVYLIFGNADMFKTDTNKESKKIKRNLPSMEEEFKRMKDVTLLLNKKSELKGLHIAGIKYFIDENWVRNFKPSNHKKQIIKAKKDSGKATKKMNSYKNIDIMLFYQPPYKVLDTVGDKAPKPWIGKSAGSMVLLKYIKKYKPKYVICGHIHEAKGTQKIGNTTVINAGCSGDFQILEI
jgi:Icc-related predicted phosphoesterase